MARTVGEDARVPLPMSYVLGLDVYGTLIDPLSMAESLRPLAGERSEAIAQLWRDKQLEYSFRRALMRAYQPFDVCTDQALQYAALRFGLKLGPSDKARLLDQYQALPPYEDAVAGVNAVRRLGHVPFAFTNGVEASVRNLLERVGILPLLEGILSVDELRTFKPDPKVYEFLLSRGKRSREQTWVVSANPFDVIGAKSAGLRAVWVKRHKETLLDPWGLEPDQVISHLGELPDALV